MANLPIKYRIEENFIHNQDDFQVTSLKGNFEVNFFICPAFYPTAPAFCHSTPAFFPAAPTCCHSLLEAKSIPF